MRQIYNKVVRFKYTDVSDITDFIDAKAYVKESQSVLSHPNFEGFQSLEEGKKFKFVVTEKMDCNQLLSDC